MLTAVLALILVYLFSIVGYIFFKDDFILEVDRVPNSTLSEGESTSLLVCDSSTTGGKLTVCCCALENGGSLASEFLSTGMCQGGMNDNCTTGVAQKGEFIFHVSDWVGF